jgi:hypothetical protein
MGSPERHIEVRDSVKRFSIINSGHAMKSVKEMGGPNVVALSDIGAPKTERGLIDRNSEGLSNGLVKVMMSKLSENVPSLKDCTAIGFSSFERVMKTEDPKYHFVSKEVLGHIEELLKSWGVVLGEPRGLYGDGVVGVCAMPSLCAVAKKFVGYSTPSLTLGDCVAVRDELLPLCKKCAVQRENAQNAERRAQNALQNPEPSPEPRGDEKVEPAPERDAELAARDAEVAQLRAQLVVAQLIAKKELDVKNKKLDEVRGEVAVRDARINELNAVAERHRHRIDDLLDERRDLEEQLNEGIENSDDKAHAITARANIMMAEQFTQTQQNYADLRQYIDQIRAEHAAFVLEAQRADAATAASSQQLERVLSEMSDETYMTANSTCDSGDD